MSLSKKGGQYGITLFLSLHPLFTHLSLIQIPMGVLHLLSLLLHLLSLPFTGCKRPGYTLIRIPDDHDKDSNPRPQEQSTVEGVLFI